CRRAPTCCGAPTLSFQAPKRRPPETWFGESWNLSFVAQAYTLGTSPGASFACLENSRYAASLVMRNSPLSPCPGCGALFPDYDGPRHRYIGASAGCWALFSWSLANGGTDVHELVEHSRIPDSSVSLPAHDDATLIESLWGDAYGVQHHGGNSPQAVQSVAVHLLDLYGIISGKTTRPGWAIERALRVRGVFQKLSPPALGSALTFR